MDNQNEIDMGQLLRLRAIVARFGEMDNARWWNTQGQLGRYGSLAIRRGFPRTHYFAQARSVFAVAAQRCTEIYEPAEVVTLWRLPANIEDEFNVCWKRWLETADDWLPFFERLESMRGSNLIEILKEFGEISDSSVDLLSNMRRIADRRAVEVPGVFSSTNEDLLQLAMGFSLGKSGSLAVPFMRCS